MHTRLYACLELNWQCISPTRVLCLPREHSTTKCWYKIHAQVGTKAAIQLLERSLWSPVLLVPSVALCFTRMKVMTDILRSDDNEVITLLTWVSYRRFQYWDYTPSDGKMIVGGLRKSRKISISVTGVQAVIRTKYLTNTNQNITFRPTCSVRLLSSGVSWFWDTWF